MPEAAEVSTKILLRPFADCSALLEERLLTRISDDTEFAVGTSYPELPSHYDGFKLECRPAFSLAEVAELWGVQPNELALVALLTVPSLKLSERIDQFDQERISAGADLAVDDAKIRALPGGTPFTVTFALVLLNDRSYKPGAPWMPGHWAGKKAIQFNSAPPGRSFNILKIPADEFPKRFKLSKDTFYYVSCSEGDVAVDRDTFQRNVTVYMRDDCHDALAAAGQNPAVDAFYKQIEADIVAQIASKGLVDASEATCSEDTVQAALLKKMKKASGLSVEELKRISQREPERFRAMVQGICRVAPVIAKTRFA
jgi:hypothetical protein